MHTKQGTLRIVIHHLFFWLLLLHDVSVEVEIDDHLGGRFDPFYVL